MGIRCQGTLGGVQWGQLRKEGVVWCSRALPAPGWEGLSGTAYHAGARTPPFPSSPSRPGAGRGRGLSSLGCSDSLAPIAAPAAPPRLPEPEQAEHARSCVSPTPVFSSLSPASGRRRGGPPQVWGSRRHDCVDQADGCGGAEGSRVQSS